MTRPLAEAGNDQNIASDPAASTWLSANAGSGKTRVLTDRVARLLLDGVDPQNILCMTYTNAAASEMQNRLFKQLGSWAMMPDGDLRKVLADFGGDGSVDIGEARTLFARAIETPGGLKIQTIHAFCASVLRRFPLEAGISPHFTEMDEPARDVLIGDVLDSMAEDDTGSALRDIARHFRSPDLSDLARAVLARKSGFGPTEIDPLVALGSAAGDSTDRIFADLHSAGLSDAIAHLRNVLSSGGIRDNQALDKIAGLSAGLDSLADFAILTNLFVGTTNGMPSSRAGKFPTKALREAHPEAQANLDAVMDRVFDAQDRWNAVVSANRTRALRAFGAAFIKRYEREKLTRGMLDFDDLIERTVGLLENPGVAAWVLFRLDGGIDHVLVDEAQDTSPGQWRVIELLTQEFGAGQGVRDGVSRTLFVVGDKKQSIYSFQGADAQGFDRMRESFGKALRHTTGLRTRSLTYSFRSSPAILRAVDRTFATETDRGLGIDFQHRAVRRDLPGRVDLWPAIPRPDKQERAAWTDEVDRVAPNHPAAQLAREIAREMRRLIDCGTQIPMIDGTVRPVHEGDFLVLVRNRTGNGELFRTLIRELKSQDLAVAGADRMTLNEELAVKDIFALLRFLALPEDSLSLATALRSPLFGWSMQDLHALSAHRKQKFLWTALREAGDRYRQTREILDDLRRQADFLRPYELIERLLTRHDGRRRLIARLGVEAEDAIDELLVQALHYETVAVPSLTGFLTWIAGSDVEIKRQLDSGGRAVRVMTVHGAKGLESPVVILADTTRGEKAQTDEVLIDDNGDAHWRTPSADTPKVLNQIRARMAEAARQEDNRLLYVAMTRAMSWLIVCGSGDVDGTGDTWFDRVQAGVETAGGVHHRFPTGGGLRYQIGGWPADDAAGPTSDRSEKAALPKWLSAQAKTGSGGRPLVSPSDLGGAKALPGDAEDADEERSKARGRLLHHLLEHLPELPAEERHAAARRMITAHPDTALVDEAATIAEEALGLLDAPGLGWVFAETALAEVDLTADLRTLPGVAILGTVDRLVIEKDAVHVIDFKSNRVVPTRPEDVPEGLKRQMGAYADALGTIYPGKEIHAHILWTRTQALMELPHDIVMAALGRAAIS